MLCEGTSTTSNRGIVFWEWEIFGHGGSMEAIVGEYICRWKSYEAHANQLGSRLCGKTSILSPWTSPQAGEFASHLLTTLQKARHNW